MSPMPWKHHRPKPVIGIIGGIGAGKSAIARLFAQEGCAVIDSDQLAHQVLQDPAVKSELTTWLGPAILDAQGQVSRKAIAAQVFTNPENLTRLNALIHPRVGTLRDNLMKNYLTDRGVKAIIWDSPLLLEAGLAQDCDAIVFVDTPAKIRTDRVAQTRGWTPEELAKREKSQIALDKKAAIADYYVDNSGDQVTSLHQVQRVLSLLFSKCPA